MVPNLFPGDGVIAIRWPRCRRGQIRVFPDPNMPTRWLIKRVGAVDGHLGGGRFEAISDNCDAVGVVDSRSFGLVPIANSMLVVATVRSAAT